MRCGGGQSDGDDMSELWQIIQGHLDEYGVREAAFARRMGTKPQTLNSWKKRGLKQLPSRDLLEAVAREARVPYGDVLRAALTDINYLGDHHDETPTSRAGVSPADDVDGAVSGSVSVELPRDEEPSDARAPGSRRRGRP